MNLRLIRPLPALLAAATVTHAHAAESPPWSWAFESHLDQVR